MSRNITCWVAAAVVAAWCGSATHALDPANVDIQMPEFPAFDRQTPAEQYQALIREHESALARFESAIHRAWTETENQRLCQNYWKRLQTLARRFIELAQENPKDPVTVDALTWVATRVPSAAGSGGAIEILVRHHSQSVKFNFICQQLTQADSPVADRLLRSADAQR
ncbi:MAG: hypothetical protein HZA91_20200 [Verrucomicrobia bacterium]|nr:hypothetical protein [Verrucomicrobiota bacterium]